MKQPTSKEDKVKNSRETLNSLCSVSALLLSVACCIAVIHVELRIQEHHRMISHSVTFCDQMETQILRKVQQNYERRQVTKADGIKGYLQGANGKERFYQIFWFLMLTSACFKSLRLWKLSLFNILRSVIFKIRSDYPLRIHNKSTGLAQVRLSRIEEYNKSHRQPKRTTCGFGLQRSFGRNIYTRIISVLSDAK